jgi:hypothetical protein
VHADESGLWHANVTVFGAWAAALGYTLDWLLRAPAECRATRRTIEWGRPWFSLVELELPVRPHRPQRLTLHVASVTGTMGSEAIAQHLFDCADLVIFQVDTERSLFDRALRARGELEPWIVQRALDALVVIQLDENAHTSNDYVDASGKRVSESPPVRLTAAEILPRLRVDAHPFVETNAFAGTNVNRVFQMAVELLLRRRDLLPPRRSYD